MSTHAFVWHLNASHYSLNSQLTPAPSLPGRNLLLPFSFCLYLVCIYRVHPHKGQRGNGWYSIISGDPIASKPTKQELRVYDCMYGVYRRGVGLGGGRGEHPCAQCLCRNHRTIWVLGILRGQSFSRDEMSPLRGSLASDIDTVHVCVFVCVQVHVVLYVHWACE